MKIKDFIYIVLISNFFLFSNACYSEEIKPIEIKVGDGIDSINEQAKFWGGLVNTKRQMDKIDSARQKLEKNIPDGETRKFDIVVKGTEFVGLMQSDKAQLRPGGSKTVAIVNIKGTFLTKKEIETKKANVKEAKAKIQREKAAKIERDRKVRAVEAAARAERERRARHNREIKEIRDRDIRDRSRRDIDRDQYEIRERDIRDRTS